MTHKSHSLATRTCVSLPAWLLLVAAAVLPGLSIADEPAKVAPTAPVLTLADGGVIPGELVDTDKSDVIRWQGSSFVAPFEFALDDVRSVRFPLIEKTPRSAGDYGFELTGGDVLFGSLLALDENRAELDVPRFGKLRVDRSRIRRVFRWRDGADLIYNGPNGLTGWREFTQAKARPDTAGNANKRGVIAAAPMMRIAGGAVAPAAPAADKVAAKPPTAGTLWQEEGGQLATSKDGVAIQGDLGLPTRASIEFEISWKAKPDFALAIGVSDDEKTVGRAFRFEVWDSQLILLRETETEGDLATIQAVPAGAGRAHLQCFLDQELGKILVFSANGDPLAELKLGGKSGVTLPGIRLLNLRGDIRLERLRIGRWDGETPRPSVADQARINLADGSINRGQVVRFEPAAREFVVRDDKGEARIPEARVSNIQFAQPANEPARSVGVVYQDGTRIGGQWTKVEGGRLFMSAPGIEGTLQLPAQGLRSLDMIASQPKPAAKDASTGALEIDGGQMLGGFVDSGELPVSSKLAWKPLASRTGSPFRPEASGRIIYRAQAPKTVNAGNVRPAQQRNVVVNLLNAFQTNDRPAPTVSSSSGRKSLYLRTGDVIPAEVTKIDENGVSFKTDFSDSTFIPNARLKAVELASESATSIKLNRTKFDRLMTLPRMQKDSPPTHLIRSKNGDILRGRVIAMDDKTLRVEVRLEEKDVARDRVSRIIWLHADETDPSKKPVEPPLDGKFTRMQAVRSDGIRMTFLADHVVDGAICGKSEVLGDCKVKVQELDQILIGGLVEKEATQLAYQNWKLHNAPEPKSAQDDGGGSPNGGAAGTEAALVGKAAPDFELELLGGKKFHLADNKGKVIVLDFWATWCGPCIQAMPQIDKVTHEFADKGVQLIAVNIQEAPAKITSMLERQKLNPTVALDRDGIVAEKYGANAIPQTVVIDREGKVTRVFIGGGSHLGDQLRESLQALMPAPADKP